MAFSLPVFNLNGEAWTGGHTPATDPSDALIAMCQLYMNSRIPVDIQASSPSFWTPTIFLRLPLGDYNPVVGDIIEVIVGSLDYYKVRWVQVTHLGFPNAYRTAVVEQCDAAGTTPRP